MAVLNKEDLLNTIKNLVGEDTSDETLSAIENINDTIDNYETNLSEDWKSKYEENDSMWRTKYKERFFSGEPTPKRNKDEEEKRSKRLTFEDLFK